MPPKPKTRHPEEIAAFRAALEEKGLSPSVVKDYGLYVDRYLDWCKGGALDLSGYQDHCKTSGMTGTTMRVTLIAVRAYHTFKGDEQKRLRPSEGRTLRADVVEEYRESYARIRKWIVDRIRPADPEASDDIMQDAALRLVRWPPDADSSAGSIVFRAVRSALVDWYKRRSVSFTEPDLERDRLLHWHCFEAPITARIFVRQILDIVGSWEGPGPQALLLRAYTEEPWEIIARALNMNYGSLMEKVLETRQDLRWHLHGPKPREKRAVSWGPWEGREVTDLQIRGGRR